MVHPIIMLEHNQPSRSIEKTACKIGGNKKRTSLDKILAGRSQIKLCCRGGSCRRTAIINPNGPRWKTARTAAGARKYRRSLRPGWSRASTQTLIGSPARIKNPQCCGYIDQVHYYVTTLSNIRREIGCSSHSLTNNDNASAARLNQVVTKIDPPIDDGRLWITIKTTPFSTFFHSKFARV